MVAELEQAGGSVDGLVQDLRKLGLTYEDVAQSAEELATEIQHANKVSKELGTTSINAANGLDNMTRSGDQSRSVLANMTGNSVQDLSQLAGMSSTAGVAVGQLAEYAADGNVKLSNLAKVAGPLAAIGVSMWAIERGAKQAAERTERLKVAMQELSTVADEQVLETFLRGLTDALLDDEGGGVQGFIDTLAKDNLPGLKRALDLAGESGRVSAEGLKMMADAVAKAEAAAAQAKKTNDEYGESSTTASAAHNQAADDIEAAYERMGRAAEAEKQIKIKAIREWMGELENIPEEQLTEIRALLNNGDLATAEALLNQLVRERVAIIRTQVMNGDRMTGRLSPNADAAAGDLRVTTTAPWTPPKSTGGGGGGGGGSSGGGGGGSGSSTPTDPMAAWDKAVSNLFDVGGMSEENYRKYIEMRMSGLKEYEDEYVRFYKELEGLNDRAAKAEQKRADEVQKALDDETKARQKAADDAVRIAKEAQDEAFRIEMAKFELGEKSVAEQRAWLDAMIAAETKYSEEYMRLIRLRNNLPKDDPTAAASTRDQTGPVTVIQNFPPGVSPTSVSVATRDYTRRGGR